MFDIQNIKYLFILFLSFSILHASSVNNKTTSVYQMKNLDRTILEATYIYISIPVKPINGIKSRLIGYVQNNIYGMHGQKVLIPKGSSIHCIESISSFPTKCKTRILTPDGKYIIFKAFWNQINTSYYVSPDKDVLVDID